MHLQHQVALHSLPAGVTTDCSINEEQAAHSQQTRLAQPKVFDWQRLYAIAFEVLAAHSKRVQASIGSIGQHWECVEVACMGLGMSLARQGANQLPLACQHMGCMGMHAALGSHVQVPA